jgi:REP element-mobilizing transposase RayT
MSVLGSEGAGAEGAKACSLGREPQEKAGSTIPTALKGRRQPSMASTYTNLLYHVVFSTKDRIPLIQPDLQERLYEYMGGIIRGEGGVLLQIGGVPDHVHLLTKLKADTAVAVLLRLLKSNSSKWVNEERLIPGRFGWQTGYAAFTVSESQAAKVRNYIRTQESHHAKVSFKEELIALLKKHRIEYDERYIFD